MHNLLNYLINSFGDRLQMITSYELRMNFKRSLLSKLRRTVNLKPSTLHTVSIEIQSFTAVTTLAIAATE